MTARRRKGGKVVEAVGLAVAKRGTTSERVVREMKKVAEARAAEGLPLGGDEMRKLVLAAREEALRKDRRFIEGQKDQRRDALAALIDDALAELGRSASARKVLDFIRRSDVIADVDPDDATISWCGSDGRTRCTSFKRFQDRVSDRRKLAT
jgi:hypothetical protein